MRTVPIDYRIETERLELRISEVDEIDFVWDATRYDGFNDGMMWDKPESKEELETFAGNVLERWRSDDAYTFTFWDKAAEKRPIGRIAVEQSCGGWSVGYWTHPKYQGAGYASEAFAGLLQFCFEVLELKVVTACHTEWNIGSRKVMERNGLRFKVRIEEGLEKNGEWIAQNTLSISRDHWRARQG